MRYTVAAVQYEPRFAEKDWNLGRLLELTRAAAMAGASLVVLPEMAATGYCFRSRAEIAPLVEPVPGGPTVEAFAALARSLAIWVVVGLPEVDLATGVYYNTAALIGPDGYIGKYRKTHSFIDETRWARDGDLGIPVFETALGRIGIIICMDADYFEPARVAALAGADVIAFPTNWLGTQVPWYARAIENGVYMVCADRWGEERGVRFAGHTAVIGPRGATLNLLTSQDGLALAEIDTDEARLARSEALGLRRPEFYQELLLSSYLWSWRETQVLPVGRPTVVAIGTAHDPVRMADQARWADWLARENGWPKVDLVVFPVGEPGFGELAGVAQSLDCHIVWGSAGADGDLTAWLMGPEGLVGSYRQVHGGPRPSAEGFVTFDLPWGRLGLLLGDDLRVPEAVRILAKRGADLIAAPVRWEGEDDRLLWAARWMENNTAIAVANAGGGSRIYHPGPDRAPRWPGARVRDEGIVAMTVVDTGSDEIRSKELLRKLQPRWYDSLVR